MTHHTVRDPSARSASLRMTMVALGWVLIFFAVQANADEPAAYLGSWSNGRGETLEVTPTTIQFGNDKPVAYREMNRATDGANFELQLTGASKINAFVGKTLGIHLEGDSMTVTGYISHADYMAGKNPQQVVTWSRDAVRDTQEMSDPPKAKPRGPEQAAHTPAAGSAERRAIAQALHAPCERDLQQPVKLQFDRLAVLEDWAAARVRPLRPNEQSIDYRRTKFKEQMAAGMFDESGEALLRRKDGRWTVLEWRFGNTDTEMPAWIAKYGAPGALAD